MSGHPEHGGGHGGHGGEKPMPVESAEKIITAISHDMGPKSLLAALAEIAALDGGGHGGGHDDHGGHDAHGGHDEHGGGHGGGGHH